MSTAYARGRRGTISGSSIRMNSIMRGRLAQLMNILRTRRPEMVSFPMITFWGSPDYIVDGFYLIRDKHDQIPRVFAWGPGYTYATHRPATVLDERGIDLRKKYWLQANDLRRMGIYMYHYSLLFPHQVLNKVVYYKNRLNAPVDTWEESVYLRLERPFRTHNAYQHVSWLERFAGEQPAAIRTMMADLHDQTMKMTQRDCADVEKLLAKWQYNVAVALLRACAHIMAVQPFYFFCRAGMAIPRKINHCLGVIRNYPSRRG